MIEDRRTLDEFTDGELTAELARRLALRVALDIEPENFCDECEHFRPFHGDRLDDTRRLCARGHRSKFWQAADMTGPDDRFGFTRIGCPDFAPAAD